MKVLQIVLVLCGLAGIAWIENCSPRGCSENQVPVAKLRSSPASEPSSPQNTNLRPVATAWTWNEKRILVAFENQGGIQLLNCETDQLISGAGIDGVSINCLQQVGDDQFLAACKETGTVGLLGYNQRLDRLEWMYDCKVASYPHEIALQDGEANLAAVSGLWSKQVSVANLAENRLKEVSRVNLDFSPGPIAWLTSDLLLVADAFSDRLALINVVDSRIVKSWRRNGHRIGGMHVLNDVLCVTDVKLSRIARSVNSDIHWGLLVANEVYSFDLRALIDDEELVELHPPRQIGGPGEGKGDPAQIQLFDDHRIVCVCQGVGELAIGNLNSDGFQYIGVGPRPGGMSINQSKTRAALVNSVPGELRIVNLNKAEVIKHIRFNPDLPSKLTSRERGEQLFFSAALSHDSWISCNTCHVDGHTNSMLNDNFSDQSFGTPKQVISLLGSDQTLPLAWNGSMDSFQQQISSSLKNTMQMDTTPRPDQVEELAGFVRSLQPPPSLNEARGVVDERKFESGRKIFVQAKCTTCHQDEKLTSSELFDVALKDESGEHRFNPPSLLGVSQRSRFFHDGRANSLHDVLVKFAHPNHELDLTEQQIDDLIFYLQSI